MCMYMSVGFHTYTCDPSETKPRATGKDRGMWEGTREGYVGTTQGSLGTLPWEKNAVPFLFVWFDGCLIDAPNDV